MAEKGEKGESGEKLSTSSNDAGRILQGNGRRAFKKPIVRQPKFEGNCEELKGHVLDCSNTRQADMFSKTTKALARHVIKRTDTATTSVWPYRTYLRRYWRYRRTCPTQPRRLSSGYRRKRLTNL
jgi:hypothetical protein